MNKLKKRCVLVFICIVMASNAVAVKAAGEPDCGNQILFVLDGSQSMKGEKWQEAVGVIGTISAMLPSDYKTAMIAYNDEIAVCTDFNQALEDQMTELQSMVPRGYTNTGMALETALRYFDTGSGGNKRIVVITDGEISMKEPDQTRDAVELYEAAVRAAAVQDVVIDVFMLGTEDFEEQISYASETTGGSIYKESKTQPVGKFVEDYLFRQLELEKTVVGTSDAESADFRISLQGACMERAKILILSESPIKDIQINCQSSDIQEFQADMAAVIELERPSESEIDLRCTLSEKGRMSVYLLREYRFCVDMTVSYSPETGGHVIKVSIVDANGNAVLNDASLKNGIVIYVDGSKTEYGIEQGSAVFTKQEKESRNIQVRVGFEKLGGIVFSVGGEKTLYLEQPPVEKEETDNSYVLLYIVIAGVCLVFALLLLLFLRAKKKTEQTAKALSGAQPAGETPKYDFSGQLVIYMLKNPMGEDMPPASVNLYLRESREPFNFSWVRDKCHMDIPLKDADKVQFQGGPGHTLCVKVRGDVTVSSGREILLHNRKHLLHYNEKLLLIFNDGEIEMEVHYKNMKPSERER